MSLRPGAVNFQEKWAGLQATIESVVRLNPVTTTTWNDHYSDIYALCEAFPKSYADTLYKETKSLLLQIVTDLLETLTPLASLPLLTSYRKSWLCYQQGAAYLNNLFSYFNRVPLRKYQPHHEVLPSPMLGLLTPPGATPTTEDTPILIRHMALKIWKDTLLDNLCKRLVVALLEEVQRDREGGNANLGMIRDVVTSFVEVEEAKSDGSLRYYQEVFEAPFLIDTSHYYQQQASRLTAELSCSDYMKHVVGALQAARGGGARFLHQTSITKFMRECEARLVVDYLESYLYTHTHHMVHHGNTTDLVNIYTLLNSIPKALQPVVQEFEDHVKEEGLVALKQLQEDKSSGIKEFVGTILRIHFKYHNMVTSIFSSHKDFTSALDRACRAFVNVPEKSRQPPKAPLLLAKYCDQLLRKSSKGIGEGEMDDRLQEAITVFRYVEDKDMFQRFYSRMLSRRLVQGLSVTMEAEENMIHKLRHACGYEYTTRLQRMVVDIKLSADTMVEFQEHIQTQEHPLPISSFSALVLQSATWPLHKTTFSVYMPPNLQEAMDKFEQFYTKKHSGRALSWLHPLSLAELKLSYLKKPYTACVSAYQMAVLLAFNQSESITMAALSQWTHLPPDELAATVRSLTDTKLLQTEGERSEVDGESLIKLNMNYSNKRTKFKITAAFQKESTQEIEQTVYDVTEDRKLHIQAAIVRVMKARKTLQHNLLVQETISQVRSRFIPNVQTIKRCIGTLMEKQYLERQEGTRATYSYMA